MSNPILVFYGSYRSDRMGIRLAEFVVERLRRRGEAVELIDAKAVNLPMLDRTLAADGAPMGEGGKALERTFTRFADDLMWWVEAAKMQRQRKQPPF